MGNITRKIIYVDDVSYNLLSAKERFKNRYEFFLAQTVAKLFDILKRLKPDLILLDINMPGVNGYDAIEKLKADERYADIPVIFLTARDDSESVRKGIKLGAAGYVAKPFTDTELIEHIERLFNNDNQKYVTKKKVELPNIIYVDDVNYNLITVKNRLKSRYTIYPAQSVNVMFEIMVFIKPDLILLDIDMPGMNGYDAIKKLKADGRYADIPVIFLTARDDSESVVESINLGAVDYMAKPFSDEELINRIDKQLNPKVDGGDDTKLICEKPEEEKKEPPLDEITLALNTEINPEHYLNELITKIQTIRKGCGFSDTDKIKVKINCDESLKNALAAFDSVIKFETLTAAIEWNIVGKK